MKSNFEVEPLKKVSLADKVAQQIEKLIIEGKLKPGDQLPTEQQLGEMFSVGRTSIREAIKALESVGLIERKRHMTIVKSSERLIINRYKIEQLYEARILLEGITAKLAANRATEEDLARIEKFLEQMNKLDYGKEYIENDVGFHTAIAKAAQNNIIYEAYLVIREAFIEINKEYVDPEGAIISRKDHLEIFKAIKERNEDLAKRLMEEHISSFRERIPNTNK